MPVNVYALILLRYGKFHVTLAYPCISVSCSCCVFSFAMITLGGSRWRKFWE